MCACTQIKKFTPKAQLFDLREFQDLAFSMEAEGECSDGLRRPGPLPERFLTQQAHPNSLGEMTKVSTVCGWTLSQPSCDTSLAASYYTDCPPAVTSREHD